MTTATDVMLFLAPVAGVNGAILAAAVRRAPGLLGFLRSWAVFTLGVVGLGLASAMAGQIIRGVLSGSVWQAECL